MKLIRIGIFRPWILVLSCWCWLSSWRVPLQGAESVRADGGIAVLDPAAKLAETGLEFIGSGFENASPVWYEVDAQGIIRVHLMYDHERSSPNRAAGHFHFVIHARPGSKLNLEFINLENIYNGRPGSVARELKSAVVSENGRDWHPVPLETVETNRIQLRLEMKGAELYVARVEPYRISDLDRFLESIRSHPAVQITPVGKTVEGRQLEIVRVGNVSAANRVFIRARAHPWEPGGNWVVEGVVRRLLRGDARAADFLKRYCVWILPMANKDGVARGRTRFNLRGRDLNRGWDQDADPVNAPENAALEQWLRQQIASGLKPHLALELHNDGNGMLHISRPEVDGLARHLERMARFEALLRRHTWFTEGSTKENFRNVGTLGDGWLARYGIDAVVHEFNCNWIAGIGERPLGRHWIKYGEDLTTVFYEYFGGAESRE